MIFPKNIAIVGVGLIGGSISLGLKNHFGSAINIWGMCSSRSRSLKAKKLGLLDNIIDNISDLPQAISLLILATPIDITLQYLGKLKGFKHLPDIIIDVASIKKYICKIGFALNDSLTSFIGTHPMCGNDKIGMENADRQIFINKPWILCPSPNINPKKMDTISQLLDILGAKKIILTPASHDKLTALSSHSFLILSSILVNALSKNSEWKTIKTILSSGFKDITRLANHDSIMKADISLTNKENIVRVLNGLKDAIADFQHILLKKDRQMLINYFRSSKKTRLTWLQKHSL